MESANQLAEGIAAAVAATKPAQEYCLLVVPQGWWSCMTKTEWSGWMQAVFSVIAIGAAFIIPLFVERRAVEQRKQNSLQYAASFAASVCGFVEGASKASSAAALIRIRAGLDSAWPMGELVRIESLPLDAIIAITSLKSIAHQARDFLSTIEYGSTIHYENTRYSMSFWSDRAILHAEVIDRLLPKRPRRLFTS